MEKDSTNIVGFCVLGGIFSEGIDLEERLLLALLCWNRNTHDMQAEKYIKGLL